VAVESVAAGALTGCPLCLQAVIARSSSGKMNVFFMFLFV